MQCVDFKRRLQKCLDDRLAPDADRALREHASVCTDCEPLMLGQKRLLQELRESFPAPSADFTARVLVRVVPKAVPVFEAIPVTATRKTRPWIRSLAGLAAAALVVAAIWPVVGLRMARRSQELSLAPASAAAKKTSGRASRRIPGTIAVVSRPRSPVVRPAPSAATSPEADEYRQLVRGLIARIPDVPESPKESIDRIAGGFRPLASTLGAAWDAIRRTLPVGRDSAPAEPQASFPAAGERLVG